MEVEAGPDVADDFVSGEGGVQVGDLALEVGALVLAADAGIAEVDASDAATRRRLATGLGRREPEEAIDIRAVIAPIAAGRYHRANFAFSRPPK